ncbi:hypothetical protein Pan258_30790 [Symmachiella dynata]|uniref:Uncharacterized protein n=1 Tax=Symmachiella dynata TaxID=2527995 RepID=A0A517ZQD3_9PLAN|nr:hypothetical protein Pan258_30790 [Symmachiella dynata]QDU44699.1 hypothetical protein Mal52_31850 [Symmachiella dynata]
MRCSIECGDQRFLGQSSILTVTLGDCTHSAWIESQAGFENKLDFPTNTGRSIKSLYYLGEG